MISAKTVIALLFLLVPLVISLLEQLKRKERADRAMREIERRQRQRPDGTPGPSGPRDSSQTLAEWIEQVRREATGEGPAEREVVAEAAPRRASLDPLDEAPRARPPREVGVEDWVSAAPLADDVDDEDEDEDDVPAAPSRRREARDETRVARIRTASRSDLPDSGSHARRPRLDRRGLRDAIVWREILGPPLALRENDERF
ncbi:MAG: hypothetical protein R3F20_10625 [Planctomycetota bacterium]